MIKVMSPGLIRSYKKGRSAMLISNVLIRMREPASAGAFVRRKRFAEAAWVIYLGSDPI
jgi:hypothetical protein